jgi:hypothetical protein
MAGAGRELAITHLAQRAAESLLGDGDTKFLENPLAEINNPPAHHPMDRRNRPALEDCGQRRVMSVVQPQRLSRSFAIDQPFRSIGVELHHPNREPPAIRRRRSSPPRCAWPRRRSPQEPAVFALADRPSIVSPPPEARPRHSHPEDQSLPPWRTSFCTLWRIKIQPIRESPLSLPQRGLV